MPTFQTDSPHLENESDTTTVTLDNGLVIIVREDHSAPVVNAQAWARTGSIHEGRWLGAGLSHVLEHMLFKGTTTRPGSRIDEEIQDAGGHMNAYTSFDRTVYWINVPDTGTRIAIDILCDIMQNATLPEAELVKELDVIRREMDMNQDDPGRRSSRRLFETAYTVHPCRHTVIGYPDIFNTLAPEDIRAYYRERYAPNNLFFVVVGAVDTSAIIDQIRTAFANSPARPLPPVFLPAEPVQVAPRETVEEAPIELGYIHLSWHIPDVRHSDVPLLDLLAVILGSGRSSRLNQRLREKLGVVTSADAWTYNPGMPGLFGVSATVQPGRYEEARRAILLQIQEVLDEEVQPAELQKALKQFTSATLATRKSMQGQGQDLGGNWISTGDLDFSNRYLELAHKATPGEILRAARTHLRDASRTLYALLPKGSAPAPHIQRSTHTNLEPRLLTLPNGLRVLLRPDHRLPFVDLRLVLLGGVLAESPDSQGSTSLLARLFMRGTTTRTAEQVASEIESAGGSLDAYSGNNSFGFQAEVLREDLDLALRLMTDVLLNPAIRQSDFDQEREFQRASLQAQRDHLLSHAAKLLRRALHGETAYGLEPLGTEESLGTLTPDALKAWRQRLASPGSGVLAIYGNINPQEAEQQILTHLGQWATPPPFSIDSLIASHPVRSEPAQRCVEERRDKKQAVVLLGFHGTHLRHPDRFALDLLQEVCSDLGSRLFTRIRDELGLAYYVGAQNFHGLIPGHFSFYAGTSGEKAAVVEEELRAQAEELRHKGVTAAELARAKAKVLGQRKIARQDLGGLATSEALDELYGLGFLHNLQVDDAYTAVTLDDIQRVAGQILDPKRSSVVRVLPQT